MPEQQQEIWAHVSKDGQVTIPPEVLQTLNLPTPSVVKFRIGKGGVTLKRPKYATVAEVTGSVPSLKEPRMSEEIKQVVADERAEEYLRKLREGRA